MKRILLFLMIASLSVVCLSGCGRSVQIEGLSRASYIEVRAFSMTEQGYTDYVISDYEVVDEICATFSGLTLKKIRNTKPLMIAYTLQFYNHSHVPVDGITVLAGGDMLDYDGELYKTEINMQAYMDGIVAKMTPVDTKSP